MRTWQKLCFRVRERLNTVVFSNARRIWWNLQGAEISRSALIPRLGVTWPHQLRIGAGCLLEDGTVFKFDGIWSPGPRIVLKDRVFIGANCEFNIRSGILIGSGSAIASGCKFIDHDHDVSGVAGMDAGAGIEAAITLESDVWLGANVIVLKGVTIGVGAVVGAGAVVTRSIPPLEIWAGVPARKIAVRTAGKVCSPARDNVP